MTERTWLEELHPGECAVLLEASWLGRIGVVVDGHPEIFPVNHAYEPETGGVVFPTNARTKLHAALEHPLVAFEVDGVDELGSGWSVLLIGPAEEITDPREIQRADARRKVRWAVSDRSHWIRVRRARLTGRRITLVGD
jgi:nitroimidazol reductase NimA-like FMN-containing flavoprotein (pyridoxamine 5'-phosphate oxidase superfamily)